MSEEFKITDKETERKRLIEMNKKADAVKFALKASLIEEKKDLDIDTFFNVTNKENLSVCVLTDMVPCKNPHCTTCLMPDRYWETADKMLKYVGEQFMLKALGNIKSKLPPEVDDAIQDIMAELREEIEKEE